MNRNDPPSVSLFGRTLVALVVLVSAVAAIGVQGGGAALSPSGSPVAPGLPATPDPPAQPALPDVPVLPSTRPAPVGPPGALFGAHVQGATSRAADQMAALEAREAQIGRRLAIAHHFYPWEKEFPTVRERDDLAKGRIPLISWNGKTLNLAIGLGQHDEMIRARARAIKALDSKVMIRWLWEMDGRKKAQHSIHPSLYIAAWRHIHDVFAAEGATNVQWVWCPNASAFRAEDERNAPAYYPGDEYVDWICADGYNWAPGRTNDQWRSFAAIYRAFYDWGIQRGKPLMVGEYGAQERNPGEKAQWITDAREALKTEFPGIKAVVYFDSNAEYDWRVTTSPEALEAFRAMAHDPWFNPDPQPLLDAAHASPMVRGIPIPLSPLQFLPRTPPKPPSVPPEPPKAPQPPEDLLPPDAPQPPVAPDPPAPEPEVRAADRS